MKGLSGGLYMGGVLSAGGAGRDYMYTLVETLTLGKNLLKSTVYTLYFSAYNNIW